MRKERYQNSTDDTLGASCLSTDTTITVATGSKFPSEGDFRLKCQSELLICTARSGNVLTVTRGAEGTTAAAHGAGEVVTHVLTAEACQRRGRDNDPGYDSDRPPFRLLDASGNVLDSSDFTTVNASSSTIVDDATGSITIRKATQGASEDWTLLTRPYSTPRTVVGKLGWCNVPSSNNVGLPAATVGFRESGTGKFVNLMLLSQTFYPSVKCARYPGPTTVATTVVFTQSPYNVTQPGWVKLVDDGTNIQFWLSHDTVNWVKVYQEARTAYMTGGPDNVFFGANNFNNSVEALTTLQAWLES